MRGRRNAPRPESRSLRHVLGILLIIHLASRAAARPIRDILPADVRDLRKETVVRPRLPPLSSRQDRKPTGWKGTGCMERFQSDPNDFDVCRTSVCFLFQQEAPYIILDPSMVSVEQEILFNCSAIPPQFRRLRGTSFPIMARTKAINSMCAWAGRDCAFNHLVEFIAHQSAVPNPPYRFAITGLLLEFEGRLGEHLAPSVSLLQEQLSVIGPRENKDDPFPYHRLIRPFQMGAWALFVIILCACILFSIGIAIVFGRHPVSWRAIIHFHVSDCTEEDIMRTTAAPNPTPPNTAVNSGDMSTAQVLQKTISRLVSYRRRQENTHTGTGGELSEVNANKLHQDYVSRIVNRVSSYRVARRLLQVAVSATVVVFLLFYEIAVVNFLFIEQSKPRIQSVERLSESQLKKYSIQKNAATEVIWHRTVDPDRKYNESTYPWYRCRTERECFDWILDPNHEASLFVGFKTIGTYEVLFRGVCENMTVYETDRQLYTFGAGWLYSGAVPVPYRREIDVQVLEMQVTYELRKIVEDDVGSLDSVSCTHIINDIDVGIIGTSILVFVMPCLTISVAFVLFYCYKKSTSVMSNARPRQSSRTTERMSRSRIARYCEVQLGNSTRRRSTPASASVPQPASQAESKSTSVRTADITMFEEGG